MENQGKRKDQIETSEKALFYSIIGFLALLLIILITN
jgi:hypothetical protein